MAEISPNEVRFEELSEKEKSNISYEMMLQLAKNPKTSSKCLNELLCILEKKGFDTKGTIVGIITKRKDFNMEEKTKKQLWKSKDEEYQILAIKDKSNNSSAFLNEALEDAEHYGKDYLKLGEAILFESNIKMEESKRRKMTASNDMLYQFAVAVDRETPFWMLEILLSNAIEKDASDLFIQAILYNPNFQTEVWKERMDNIEECRTKELLKIRLEQENQSS